MDENGLRQRIGLVAEMAECIEAGGVPIVSAPGGHAVHVDAARLLPPMPSLEYPGVAFANALYFDAGVRTGEIGRAILM